MLAYFNAFQSGDYHTAYDQLSTRLKGIHTEQWWVDNWFLPINAQWGQLKNYTINNVQEQGPTAIATVTLNTEKSGQRVDKVNLINDNGVWKIENYGI